MYDSTEDTERHIALVQERLREVLMEVHHRALDHDKSKLEEPEKSMFDKFTPKLQESKYGSDEYKAATAAMMEDGGLQHHYANNRHHPEFHPHGVDDMNLIDIIEMLADWKASISRSPDGDLGRSIKMNAIRFGYASSIERLLVNTARDLGWL